MTTEATCTTEGVRTYVCKNDSSHTYTEPIPAAGHNYESSVTTEPTCTTDGVRTYVCKNDSSHTYTEPIPAVAHDWSSNWISDENNHWHKCNACEETTDVGEHIWNSGVITTSPTCTTAGEKTYTCSECERKKTEVISATGHNFVHHEAQEATCTAIGWKAYDTCNNCNYSSYQEIPVKDHSYGEATYKWSADNQNCTAERKCTVCDNVENETAATTAQVVQARNCTLPELTTYSVTFENSAFESQTKKNVQTADATGHSYGEATYKWSADNQNCTAERKCTVCDNVENETAATTAQVVQARNCTLPELTTYSVTFENSAFESQTKKNVQTADATGHSYGEATYKWSADNQNCTAERKCTVCDNVENETAATTAQVVQARNCTLPELTTYSVTFENSAFESQTKKNVQTADATGHSYGEATYKWSADNQNCTAERKCTVCDNVENETAATTAQVVQARNCTLPELTTYSVTFENSAFESQTKKNVQTADATGHNLKKVEKKDATATEEGNSTYWFCDKCNKYFSDAKAETEIKKEDTVLAKLSTVNKKETEASSAKTANATKVTSTTDKITKSSPKTGDSTDVQLYVILMLVSIGAAAGAGAKRKLKTQR